MAIETFALRGEFIALAALLKASGATGSGGEAKAVITQGAVRVNGELETRRRRKIRVGDRVVLGERTILLVAAPTTASENDQL